MPSAGKEGDPLQWPARIKIALGTAEGLAYLHDDAKLIHRDIKVQPNRFDMLMEHKGSALLQLPVLPSVDLEQPCQVQHAAHWATGGCRQDQIWLVVPPLACALHEELWGPPCPWCLVRLTN